MHFSISSGAVQAFCSAVFLASSQTYHDQRPFLALSLQPHLINGSSIFTQISIKGIHVSRGTKFLTMPLEMANVPTSNYNASNPIIAHDSLGPIQLYYEDIDKVRTWYMLRTTSGPINLSFIAYPRDIVPSTRPGPRFDLREDQGGLIGSGVSFLPEIVFGDELDISVSWDLSHCPNMTTVWTYSENVKSKIHGHTNILSKAVFAMGPLQTRSAEIMLDNHPKTFAMYYFGTPPFSPDELFERLAYLYEKMAAFFSDDSAGYKIFIRRSTARSYGGTAFHHSFVFEWSDDEMIDLDIQAIFELLAHEMVHNWIRLDRCGDDPCGARRTWYMEGIAVYYAAVLPYRFGMYDRNQFLEIMNGNAQAYFTSPLVNMSNEEVSDLGWSTFHAQRIPYYRGFMYFAMRDDVDGIVLEMLRRQRTGFSYGPDDLKRLLGGEPIMEFETNTYAPQYELGFDESLDYVSLVPGSRASEVLKEGDDILNRSLYGWTADRMRKMRVRTSGRVVEYWPRGQLVRSWKWE